MSVKHGGHPRLDNLAYACAICNRRKGSDVASIDPLTGELVPVFNPRLQRWGDHFRLDAEWIIPITRTGESMRAAIFRSDPAGLWLDLAERALVI